MLVGILITFVIVIDCFAAMSLERHYGINYGLALGILAAIEIAIFIVSDVIKSKKKTKLQNIENEKKMAAQRQQEFENNSLLIYKKCAEKKIHSIETDDELSGLKIIASNFGVNDIEKAKESFAIGKELFKKENQSKVIEARENDQKLFNSNYQQALISGKEKYTHKIKTEIANAKVMAGINKVSSISAKRCMNNQHEKDWAIAGGIADGIAGPAAGIATAIKVQNDNAAARVKKEGYRSEYLDAQSKELKYQNKAKNKQYILDVLENKLCDENDIQKKFEMLSFSDFKASDSYGGGKNITVGFNVSINGKIQIIDSDAVIDGSVKINVLDKTGNNIGCGYYCAPGFDETDLNKVGFSNCDNPKVLCIIDDYDKKYNLSDLSFSVEPVKLWYIEV